MARSSSSPLQSGAWANTSFVAGSTTSKLASPRMLSPPMVIENEDICCSVMSAGMLWLILVTLRPRGQHQSCR